MGEVVCRWSGPHAENFIEEEGTVQELLMSYAKQ